MNVLALCTALYCADLPFPHETTMGFMVHIIVSTSTAPNLKPHTCRVFRRKCEPRPKAVCLHERQFRDLGNVGSCGMKFRLLSASSRVCLELSIAAHRASLCCHSCWSYTKDITETAGRMSMALTGVQHAVVGIQQYRRSRAKGITDKAGIGRPWIPCTVDQHILE